MALSPIAEQLSGFFQWWLSGLKDLVPEHIQQRFRRERDTIYVRLSEGEAVITQSRTGQQTTSNTFRFALGDRPTSERTAAFTWLKRHRQAGARILIQLPASEAIRKSVTLPLAAEENLREVIGFEIDRLTPFSPEEIYFDYQILERDPNEQRLRLELLLSSRAVVQRAVVQLRSWGFSAQGIAFADPANSNRIVHEMKLLTNDGTNRTRSRGLWVQWGLIAVLFLTAIGLPLYLNERKLAHFQRESAAVRKQAAVAMRLRQELEQLSGGAQYLVEKRRNLPLRIESLDHLARLMPDDAWLNRLQLDGSQITIQGEANTATTLIEKLESSKEFAAARFTSPVRQNTRSKKEQYNLSAELVSGKK